MSLSLTCSCGTRFEVDDTYAGQEVSCPECQQPVRVPAPVRVPLRTSDWAIASTILALVGSFTVIGTVLAVIVGMIAVVSISRHRDRLAGTGYAVFGIVWGLAFTGLSLFAYSTDELFGVTDQLRKQQFAGELDDPLDLTITRPRDGYSITRPSHEWGVARASLQQRLGAHDGLSLVNAHRNLFVDVRVDHAPLMSLESYREMLLESYRKEPVERLFGNRQPSGPKDNGFALLSSRVLPARPGLEMAELVVDLKVEHQPLRYLIRLVKETDTGRVFVARGWTARRRFVREEPELRGLLDSLHSLARPDE